ncbi:TetR/AcrR family transcriptional regulator [Streptomyces sp. NPDC048172]|uniref:TetR/AcrR family transcriptional regulator n=1 Tax=Streptomyces sp. NPDC048172 TaxID=3365505 RepID=UPI00371E2609
MTTEREQGRERERAQNRTRRAPAPGERRQDAERSRRLLLDAAKEEFAAKGFAGARVQDIADRAGLNKQLISYHFGGKEGLWNALTQQWLEHEKALDEPEVPLDEVVERYLRAQFADPRGPRLSAWAGLTGTAPTGPDEDLTGMEARQAAGEIGADLDPAAVLLMLTGATAVPLVMPQVARAICGLDPDSPEFQDRYAEQLRRIVRRLA